MNPQPTLYGDSGAAAAGAGIFGGFMGLIYLAVLVLAIVAMWKIFTKAGEPGWYSIIPIWNTLVLIKIVGRPMWWILLFLIPLVNLIIMIILMNDLSKSFGHGVGFTLGLIFLSFIFMLILGFNGDPYLGPGGKAVAQVGPPAGGYAPPPPSYQPPAPPSA